MNRRTEMDRMYPHRTAAAARAFLSALMILICLASLSSCTQIRDFFRKKTEVTFFANGGKIAEEYIEKDKNAEPGADAVMAKCFTGDPLPDDVASMKYYRLEGWYTEPDGGKKIKRCPEDPVMCYAHWESANDDRTVEISGIGLDGKEPAEKGVINVRISKDDKENDLKIKFTVDKWYGQDIAFVDKNGGTVKKIESGKTDKDEYGNEPFEVTCGLPDRKWMDRKSTTYRVKTSGNDHVDECGPFELKVKLEGQYKYFDRPVEGSMVWYGGAGDAPADRAGVVLATDDDFVYAKRDEHLYKWKKSDVMINMADVRTDIVLDIYNAYSSRFFPIKGKAMYMDNGKKGLKRYAPLSKASAMHKNRKTGKTTFMAPVQWDFAEKVAKAQAKARDAGVTLYIVDSFRPANSVDPVAKKVKDPSLLAYGGTSAHNFGTAVDTGWQNADKDGKPFGEPFVRNLQALDKKKAVRGPHGNSSEIWWEGVNKLPQEWWHYGDTSLKPEFRENAKRTGSLYVNQKDCLSVKRSEM